jgi:methylmalonic aciduria homocystinuria type C protein
MLATTNMAATSKSASSIPSNLSATLAVHGFDICHEFDAAWYNTLILEENQQLKPIPTFGRSSAFSLLIGNTRHFWPAFLAWLRKELEKDNELMEHPVDTYVHSIIEKIIGAHFDGETNYKIFWSDLSSSQQLVSMQRVASVSGLCYHDNHTQLSIHPEFGPWLAFRAVVVLDRPFLTSPPPLVPCLLSATEKENAKKAMAAALAVSDQTNLCKQLHGGSKKEDTRLAWVALRDCITTGRNYRYTDGQLIYHYTKDTKVLMKELNQKDA